MKTNMKYTFIYITVFIAASLLFLTSCAQELEESTDSVQERILNAYIQKYHPDATRLDSGTYLLDSIPGTGIVPHDTSYVLVRYSITYLSGSYIETSYDSVAKQLGTYETSGYYEPVVWYMPECSNGLREILTKMKAGGKIMAILPSKQLNEENDGYFISSGDGASKIYDIELIQVINDFDQYQYDEIRKFAAQYYPKFTDLADTTEYGFFFCKTETHPEDTLKDSEFLTARYVGRYLNYNVFDTNIADTAKLYRMYDKTNEAYATISFQHRTEEKDALEGNSFVKGFSKALNMMNYGEKAIVIFYQDLGYGSSGSGNIPGYVPLCFELYVEPSDELVEEEEES